MHRVFCHTEKVPKPVYAASFETLEAATERMDDIIAHARLAKSLGADGDKYLAGIYKVIIKDGDGNVEAEVLRDEVADDTEL